MSDQSDFSGGSGGGGNDQKHKKDRKKVKERPYAHLGEDLSSADDDGGNNETKSPIKLKKSKAFMFGSAKKDKKKEGKGESSSGLAGGVSDSIGNESKKKDKHKLKLKKSSKHSDKQGIDEAVDEEPAPIFGVPLNVAAQRHKCHDEIKLPLIVRECIDFIEHGGGIEIVSSYTDPRSRIEGIKNLMLELPECNRVLIQWVFVHMTHVIERERFNKMSLQNVSIVLKTLNSLGLPECPEEIEEEIRKQDSLLGDLHLQISSGAASKKTEEQIWEQQRIVTQLKRKLRTEKKKVDQEVDVTVEKTIIDPKPKYEPIDYDEIIDFTLRELPIVEEKVQKVQAEAAPVVKNDSKTSGEGSKLVKESETNRESSESASFSTGSIISHSENKERVIVENVEAPIETAESVVVQNEISNTSDQIKCPSIPLNEESKVLNNEIKAIPESQESMQTKNVESKFKAIPESQESMQTTNVESKFKAENVTVIRLGSNEDEQDSIHSTGFPLLPPPPGKSGNNRHQRVLQPVPAFPPKSKSLPREFSLAPSKIYDFFENEEMEQASPIQNESKTTLAGENLLEVFKLEFEYDELKVLESELMRRKEIEKKEILELKEEIASMQTLYQYRTCSVDSSESSSDEASDKEDGIEELAKTLSDLIRENKELEDTRMELQQKIQDERSACINLRVQIRVEREKLRLKA
ncbi:RALBP1 [Lepeophtheirus salmonis]|uniref:RALBP1 n=1 Tax=Lepeophtheirus salmonis TaxID=72036 RepID=A0A7R8H260_LEPSM|nr:RALBP1 [Lepeophtheirus salmonis]CAF2822145.1 RALBP1 [Lepeophtheirus salmonis]